MTNPIPMTTKEYLEQPKALDREIDAMVVQLSALRALSTRVTSLLSGMPRTTGGNPQALENTIVRIVVMEHQIDDAIDRLLLLKHEVMDTVQLLPDKECQELLIRRYLGNCSWSDIAATMNYSERYIFKLHDKALMKLEAVLPVENRTRSDKEDGL